MLKFWPTTIVFIIGVVAFFYFHQTYVITYWWLILWIHLFLLVQFCGAYFISLNFHLESVNSLKGNTQTVMLTFDDGPHPNVTPEVLNVLSRHNVKAVFFLIGENIPGQEGIVKQIIAQGHRIGNHSYSHHNLIDLWSTNKVTADFDQCQKLITQFQPQSKLFRPPYGVTNPNIARAVKRTGLQSIGWNIRSYDTSIKDVAKIKARVLSQLKPGAIILLHDRLDFMPQLLDELIPEIKARGFSFTSVV